MERSRRLLVALVVALVLTVVDPAFLDLLRYPVALVASWPARAMAGIFGPEPLGPGDFEAEAGALAAELAAHFPDPDLFRVFRVDHEDRHAFLVGGWEQGVASGDRVLAGDTLVGFVERVESRWCRVRVLGNRHVHLSGLVALEPDEIEAGIVGELLLSGSGGTELVARQGSRIAPELIGREVLAPDPDAATARWSIGRIERDERLDLVVVRCLLDLDGLDDLRILGRAAAGPLDGGRVLDALVLAEGGGAAEPRNFLIGRGSADGLRVGSWVSQGGRLIGRVLRAGPFSARVLALDDIAVELPALELRHDGALPFLWSLENPGRGPAVSRGRGRHADMPRGLALPGAGEGVRRPVPGERVLVHVVAEPAALLRLGAAR